MRIDYISTPKQERFFDKNPADDVVEIFKTPLTGAYNWDYRLQEDRIKQIYELGKKLNWNVEVDIDWDVPFIDPLEEFEFEDTQWEKHKDYKKLNKEMRRMFFKDTRTWTISQFLHGEQGALLVASQLCSCAPTYNAKLYAASQTFDEARHVEAFNKYLQTRLYHMWPIGNALKSLIDKILTDERWDLKFIGMQIVIEGLALAAFQTIKEVTQDPVLKQLLEFIIRDEARHVTFGIHYLKEFVQTLSEEEKLDRAKFALEACTVSRNRLRSYDVWKKYGFDMDYTNDYILDNVFSTRFQDILFTRVMPNLKRIGLLPNELKPDYEKLGVLGYADGDSDYETSWIELSKPLQYAV